MNEYEFKDLREGMQASFEKKITAKDISDFVKVTGDNNPLHVDTIFYKDYGFKAPVVHGLLVNSMISTLCGVHLPGKYCLILSIESSMKNPCYEDDILKIKGEIIEKVESMKTIVVKTTITNQDLEVIQSGKVYIKLLK